MNASKSKSPNERSCDFSTGPAQKEICGVDINHFGPCSPDQGYGLNRSAPCFFLKLNRVSIINVHWYSFLMCIKKKLHI